MMAGCLESLSIKSFGKRNEQTNPSDFFDCTDNQQ